MSRFVPFMHIQFTDKRTAAADSESRLEVCRPADSDRTADKGVGRHVSAKLSQLNFLKR